VGQLKSVRSGGSQQRVFIWIRWSVLLLTQASATSRAHFVRKDPVAATVVHSYGQGLPQCRFP
jgi:hypothetical protein